MLCRAMQLQSQLQQQSLENNNLSSSYRSTSFPWWNQQATLEIPLGGNNQSMMSYSDRLGKVLLIVLAVTYPH